MTYGTSFFFKPKIRKLDMCMPAFMQMDMMSQFGPVWILGMPFFRFYHTTFDRKDKAMRFGKAGPDCEPLPFPKGNAEATQEGEAADEALLAVAGTGASAVDRRPVDVDIRSIIPPRLSEMMDYPFGNSR